MSKELINELTNFEEVELVYANVKQKDGKTDITYNVVCDINSITEDIYMLKRIVAVMEVIKTLLSNHDITVNYNIKTSIALEEDIINNDNRTIKDLTKADILYKKNDTFTNMINSNKKTR